MPTKPKAKSINGNSSQIINAVLNDRPDMFGTSKTGIRADGSIESIHRIGEMMSSNNDWSNAFIHTLMNRIVLVVYQGMYFENPWKRFKRGLLSPEENAGDAVEEIAFNLCDPHLYDSTSDLEFPKQEIPDLKTKIHRINYQEYYKRTINRAKLLRAFLTETGMEELVNYILSTMYTSAEYDEYVSMKYLLGRYSLDGFIYPVKIPEITGKDSLEQVTTIIKGLSNNLTLLSGTYNKSSIPTKTDKINQIILVNTKFDAQLDVEVLAYAFNMDRADLYGQRVLINDFTIEEIDRMDKLFGMEKGYKRFTNEEIEKLNSVPCWILDDRFFMIFDALMEMTSFQNPEKLYWNYWLHTWKILSASTFVNALMLTTTELGVDSLVITPTVATVTKGSTLQFSATVQSQGFPIYGVYWKVSGNTSIDTNISDTGLLTIGMDEESEELIVTAVINETTTTTKEVNATITVV